MINLKALVIGLGSIGTRHAKNLMQLGIEVEAIEPDLQMRSLQINYVNSITESSAEIAVICSPTQMHISQATECANKDMYLFIEKPPSNNLLGFSELEKILKEKKLIAMVACNFRFTDGLQLIKKIANDGKYGKLLSVRAYFGQYLPNMRKGRDYRTLYAAGPAGGVVLDSFHEFDYLYWFLGKPKKILSWKGRLSKLDIQKEDTAEIILQYPAAIANIHVDYLRRKYKRSCEFIFDDATISWDYLADEQKEVVELFDNDGNRQALLDTQLDVNKMYLEEMNHFLDCVRNKKEPVLGIKGSKRILKTIIKVLR